MIKEKLNEYVKECKNELDEIGIYYGTVLEYKINTRAKRKWGDCKRINDDSFVISISEELLSKGTKRGIKQTIMHELLHTIDGCFNHQQKWKMIADYVNKKCNYDIQRTNTAEELGLSEEEKLNKSKYIFKCEKCGQTVYRTRKSKFTENYKKYFCANNCCYGKFKKIK